MTTHYYSEGNISIPYGETNIYAPEDFKTGNVINTPLKRELHNLIAKLQGGWSVCYQEYLRNEGKITGKCVVEAVTQLMNPDKFEEYVRKKGYKDDVYNPLKPCRALKTAQQKCMATICANAGDQWKSKFNQSYYLNTGMQPNVQKSIFEEDVITKSLDVKPTTIKSVKKITTSKKSDLLAIALEVNKLLEPLDDADREYVLNV